MTPDEDRNRDRELARGEWWLPAFPDKRLHGTLRLLADHRTRLDLFGQFPELPEGGYAVVLGETDGGARLSLHRTVRTAGTLAMFSPNGHSVFEAAITYEGAWFETSGGARFSRLGVELTGLLEWLRPGNYLKEEWAQDESSVTISNARDAAAVCSAVIGEFVVSAESRSPAWLGSTLRDLRLGQTAVLMVSTADPKPLTEHLDLVFAFRKLFWLLCRQPANVISISGESEMGRRRVHSGEEIRQPVTVYIERLTAPRDDYRPGLPPGADAGVLAPHFQQVFEKWVDQGRRLPAVHQLFFLPQLGLPLLVEARFLNLAQAAEAYARTEFGAEYMSQKAWAAEHYKTLVEAIPPQLDRDHRRAIESRLRFLNAYSFNKLMTLLVERTPAVADLIRCPSAFAAHVTNFRNHLVHLSGAAPTEADRHPPLQALVWYLEILLHTRFLGDLGFLDAELALAINDGFTFPERRLLTHYWSELPRHYRPSVG